MNNNQTVYQCDTCNRSVRIPSNNYGLGVIRHCFLTENCVGVMRRNSTIINPYSVNTIAPEVDGLTDWTPRRALINFSQGIPSTTWTIKHDMGVQPIIHAFTLSVTPQGKTTYTEIFPISTSIVDANTSQIKFSTPQHGVAQCIATTTAPYAAVTTTQAPTTTSQSFQITNGMTMALATSSTEYAIPISVTVTPPSGNPITKSFSAATYQISQTAWANAQLVVIGNNTFTTRAIMFNSDPQTSILLANGTLVNGSAISFNVQNPNSVLVLLANPPFTTTDQIANRYVDAINLTTTSSLFYNNGELYAYTSAEKRIFPPIIRV